MMTTKQEKTLVNLLWDNLKTVPFHSDRRQTAWGDKTKEGLVACIQRVTSDPDIVDPTTKDS